MRIGKVMSRDEVKKTESKDMRLRCEKVSGKKS